MMMMMMMMMTIIMITRKVITKDLSLIHISEPTRPY